jgi:GT2 family glycosyltransferase
MHSPASDSLSTNHEKKQRIVVASYLAICEAEKLNPDYSNSVCQEPMEHPQVTIVVVPRERFSQTQRSLEDLYEHTTLPFHLIYVDAGAPPRIQRYLEEAARQKNFELIRVDRYLSPNQARNLAQRQVKTKYVVFLDNDTRLTPFWLEKLVNCAEETGAWVVGPLYLIGELSRQTIHMAGGVAHTGEQDGERIFYDEHLLVDTSLADVRDALQRRACDYVEFHCALVKNEVFERLGPLDEQLLSVHEHIDLGLNVKRAGGLVYIEPGAVITFIPPPPCDWRDLPYFMMRWSEAWNQATVRHFKEKWGYSSMRSFDDQAGLDSEDTILRWARRNRRRLAGLRILGEGDDGPESPREEAQCMVALFLSVDREAFDLGLVAEDEHPLEELANVGADAVFDRLSGMLARAHEENLNLMIRPLPAPASNPVVLLRLDDMNKERLAKVRSHAFLVLETGAETYQCWLAITKGDPRSAALWRRLGLSARAGGADPVRIAGSRIVSPEIRQANGGAPRVRLVEGHSGLLNPLWVLEEQGLLPLLRCSILS